MELGVLFLQIAALAAIVTAVVATKTKLHFLLHFSTFVPNKSGEHDRRGAWMVLTRFWKCSIRILFLIIPTVLSLARCAANILFNTIPVVFYWVWEVTGFFQEAEVKPKLTWHSFSSMASHIILLKDGEGPHLCQETALPSLLHHHRHLTRQRFFHSPVIRWSCGRVLLQPICFKAQWVVRCEMPQCTLMLYSAVMCIFVAHLVAWMNVAILPSPQDETADCMFLNHWIQLCVDGQNQMLKITETFVFY